MDRQIFSSRLDRLLQLMEQQRLDAYLVSVPENRFYLSGYEAEDHHIMESSGHLYITPDRRLILTDSRYEEEARREAPDFELIVYSQGLAQVLPGIFSDRAPERFGVEGHYLTYRTYREIEEVLRASKPKSAMVSVNGLAEKLRLVKEPSEIELIRASLALTEKVLLSTWERLAPGRTEKEVAWEIERGIREGGGQAVSFPPIVAGGPNAALPHAVPTDRTLKSGEPVVLDLGSKLSLYCSDMTRTWISGRPEAKIREIYRVVREAQIAGQEAVRAGVDSVAVDAAARGVIERAGYGDRFGHGLGHGVGLAVHEGPGLRRQNATILEENMVVTVEPGIYLPGSGGVRLENMVRVTRNGCEVLNSVDLFYAW